MRSETEKARDVVVHEKRYAAEQVLEDMRRYRRKARVSAAIGAVAAFAVMITFIMSAYDSENLPLTLALIALWIVVIAAVYYISGGVFAGSLVRFVRGASFIGKWENAIADFEAISEKSVEKTAMPGEVEKYEAKLVALAEKIAGWHE